MNKIKPINVTLSGEDYETLCNLLEKDNKKIIYLMRPLNQKPCHLFQWLFPKANYK